MANAVILFPNYVDADPRFATVSIGGGNWTPEMPVGNLLTATFAEKARSGSVTEQDTRFMVDLGVRRAVKGVALVGHNMSLDAEVLIDAFDGDPTGQANPTPNSGTTATVTVYPKVYPIDATEFDAPEFWFGQVTEENADITPTPVVHVYSNRAVGRYWRFRIRDANNPAGYLEISRLFIAPGYQASLNISLGAQLGFEDRSPVFTARSGAQYFDALPQARTAAFSFAHIPTNEALVNIFDGKLRSGRTEQVFFSLDPDNDFHRQRWSFPATLTALSPVEATAYGLWDSAFEIREVIA